MASICQLLIMNLPEIPDRRHISLAQNQSSPSVALPKGTLFELSTTLCDDRSCSHAYMQPRYEHTHFLPQYWSGQNRTSRTACAGPVVTCSVALCCNADNTKKIHNMYKIEDYKVEWWNEIITMWVYQYAKH